MARSTRYFTRPSNKKSYKRPWQPTDKQKELAAVFGLGSKEHLEDAHADTWKNGGSGFSQEDKYRLQLWMEKAQLGSLDNLELEEGQLDLALKAANDFKEHAESQGTSIDWRNDTFEPDDIEDLTTSISETEGYDHLARELPASLEAEGTPFGRFDIADEDTTGLQGLSEEYAQSYESQYIDEMYGTESSAAGTEGGGLLATGEDTEEFGLDLVRDFDQYIIKRDYNQEEPLEVGSDEHYEHMTRGEVDWANYRDDPKYQKAFRLLGYDKEVTGKGDHADQIHHIRKATDLINFAKEEPFPFFGGKDVEMHGIKWKDVKKGFTEWHKDDWKYELTGQEYTIKEDGTPGGRLYRGEEMQIEFTELMDKNSPYYIEPGQKKTFNLGTDKDGKPITKEYSSPIARDLGHLIYDPDEQDQSEDHVTPSGQKVEAKVEKKRDVERPDIDGISWESGSPKLTNAVTKKKAPTIKPISTKSYAQE